MSEPRYSSPGTQILDRQHVIAFAWADDHLTDEEFETLSFANLAVRALTADEELDPLSRSLLAAWLAGHRLVRRSDGQLVSRDPNSQKEPT